MVGTLTRRSLRLALVVCPLVAAAMTVGVESAGATIVNVQTGTLATGSSGNVTPTLASASTSGTLLVAVLTNKANGNAFSAPAGWTQAITGNNSCCGRVDIWYYANNPGGITSAAFTSAGGTVAGQLSEWNGVLASSPLDQTKQQSHGSGSSFTITTSGNLTASNELGIAVFQNSGTSATSQTATSPWAQLFNDLTQDRVADYDIGLASGAAASDTETVSPNLSFMAAIATFEPALCNSGSLSLSAPSSTSFSALSLNGTDQTATATLVLTPDDERNTGAGWNVTGTSTTLTNAGGRTLPTTATTVTAASTATTGGNCVMPTNSITYPITLPAGATAPTAVKLYNAAVNTGEGPTNVTLTFHLAVHANAYIGPYTSTWTFAAVSGP
jgi:hypothetical protein